MDVFSLSAKISLDTNEYNNSLDQASGKTQTVGEKIKSGFATAAKVGGAAVAGLSAGLVKGAKDTAEYGDAIDKNSQKIGISAEAYQEWDFILQHSGTSVDVFQSGVRTLSKTLNDADEALKKSDEKFDQLNQQLADGKITNEEYMQQMEGLRGELWESLPALEALGIDLDQIVDVPLEDALAAIIAKLQEMPEGAERNALAMELFGRSAMELGPILNTSAEDTEAMRQKVHELLGVMSNEGVKDSAAFQDSLQNMQVAFDGIKRTIFENLLPAFTKLMDFISEGIAKFRNLDEGTQNLILRIGGITAAAAPVIVVVSKISSGIGNIISVGSKLIPGIGKLIGTLGKLFTLMLTNPIALVVAAVAALVAGIIYLWNTSEEFREFWIGLWEKIKETVSKAVEGIKEFFKNLWENIKEIFGNVREFFAEKFTQAKEAIQEAWAGVKEFFGEIWENIKTRAGEAWENVKEKASSAWENVKTRWSETKEFFGGVWENVKTTAAGAWEDLKTKSADAWKNVKENWGEAKAHFADLWDNVKKKASDAWDSTKEKGVTAWEKVQGAWDNSKEFFAGVWESISAKFSDAPAFFKDKFSSAWENTKSAFSNVRGFFEEVAGKILKAFNKTPKEFMSIGKDMLMGLWNGIADKVEWLRGKVVGVVEKIKSWFTGKDGFDEHSPSKWAKQVFRYVMEGGGIGLDDGSTALFRDVDHIVGRIKDSMDFSPVNVGFSASGRSYDTRQASQRVAIGGGDTYVTIHSPVAVDAIQAAREWKKTTQRMALGYV